MIVNGNLKFHTLGSGQLENAVIERLASDPSGVAGRIYYNTTDGVYKYHNGTAWTVFATGGDATTLQTEVNAIETTLGTLVNADGTQAISNLTFAGTATTLTGALNNLASTVTAHDALSELEDVTFASLAANDLLQYVGGEWVNKVIGSASSVQAYDLGLTNVAALSGSGLVALNGDTAVQRTITAATTGLEGISIADGNGQAGNPTVGLSITGLTAGSVPSATAVFPMFDGTNNVKVTRDQIADAVLADGVNLDDLADVTATGAAAYDVIYRNSGNTGWVIGATGATSKVQNYGAALDDFNELGATNASNQFYYATSGGTLAFGTVSPYGRSLIDDADATEARSTLGLVIGTDVQAHDADLDDIAAFVPTTSAQTALYGQPACTLRDMMVSTGTGTATTSEGSRWELQQGTTLRTSLGLGDIATFDQDNFIKTNGTSTVTSDVTLSNFKIVNLGSPTSALDAVNKTYVDNLVTSGTKWVDPIRNPDLVGIADNEPTAPLASGMYVAYTDGAGTGWPQTWTLGTPDVTVNEYDMMHYTFGNWQKVGTLTAGTRVMVGVFTNGVDATAGQNLSGSGLVENDLAQYVGTSGSNPFTPANWSYPHGRSGGVTPFTIVSATAGTKTFVFAGDVTSSFHAGNQMKGVTGPNVGTYNIETVTFSTNTSVVVEEAIAADVSGTSTAIPEMVDGVTTLDNNSSDSHFGQTYLYVDGSNEWVQIAGPGSVDAGTGLGYSGTTLNILLGSGIKESPSDNVGIDLYNETTGALILTDNGSDRADPDTVTSALHLKTNTTQFDQNAANGLFLKAAGITATELASSIAGAGLAGGAGTALSVNVDDSSIEINSDTLRVKADGITNAMLLNDAIGLAADSGSGTVALGSSLSVLTGQGLTSSVASGTITISGDDASTSAKGVAQFNDDHFNVVSGAVSIEKTSLVLESDSATSSISLITTGASNLKIAGGTGVDTSISGSTFTVTLNAALDELNDVNTSSVATGDLLTKSGTDWVPVTRAAMAGSIVLNDLNGVDTTGQADGTVLVHNGTDWVAQKMYYSVASASNTTHVITHGLGQKYCNVTVVETSSDEVVIPQSIKFDTVNQLTVAFNTAIAATIIVMGVA